MCHVGTCAYGILGAFSVLGVLGALGACDILGARGVTAKSAQPKTIQCHQTLSLAESVGSMDDTLLVKTEDKVPIQELRRCSEG